MPRVSRVFTFFFRDIHVLEDGIDNRVAGHADLITLNAFVQEMLPRSPGRGEEQVRDRIRHHPVDLFGHRPVETYEASLHKTDQMGSFAAASAPASTVFVSPWTSTMSGCFSMRTCSTSVRIRLVCSAWDLEPTSRLYFSSGNSSSRKKVQSSSYE